jgi:hypothetical protein
MFDRHFQVIFKELIHIEQISKDLIIVINKYRSLFYWLFLIITYAYNYIFFFVNLYLVQQILLINEWQLHACFAIAIQAIFTTIYMYGKYVRKLRTPFSRLFLICLNLLTYSLHGWIYLIDQSLWINCLFALAINQLSYSHLEKALQSLD